jgi:hypothetical protein
MTFWDDIQRDPARDIRLKSSHSGRLTQLKHGFSLRLMPTLRASQQSIVRGTCTFHKYRQKAGFSVLVLELIFTVNISAFAPCERVKG